MFKYFDKYLSEDENDIEKYFNEFDKEIGSNSDRGIALICGSIIDNLLADLLKSFLIKEDSVEKKLLGVGKPLGTFDAKINMAFYLGLISKSEFQNIVLIQKVRNKFAHQVVNISFENDKISNICLNFRIPKNSFIPSNIPIYKKDDNEIPSVDLNPIKKETSSKDRFIFTSKYIFITLLHRINGEELGSREEYNKEIKAHESIMLIPNRMMSLLYEFKEAHEKEKEKIEQSREKIEEMKKDLMGIEDGKKKEEIQKNIEIAMEENADLLKKTDMKIQDSENRIKDYQEVYEFSKGLSIVLKNSME